MTNTTVPLKRIARFEYGDALSADARSDGRIPVVGSGGPSGFHSSANTAGPVIVVGRKGSFGTIHWQPHDCFVIDTAYSVQPLDTETDLRWLFYALQAVDLKGVSQDVGVPGLSRESAYAVQVPSVSVGEQRRIADFLDAETARIDQIIDVRRKQVALVDQRFRQILDGATAGFAEALTEIGFADSSNSWKPCKIARHFSIIPGFAFPSAKFVEKDDGVRLLRGINVTPEGIDWNADTVSWDVRSDPVDHRFKLTPNDVVVGMDRPWIGRGMRVVLVREDDLPALLLQRVACIRSRDTQSPRFLRWVLASTHFRSALESETTGVSVPHISADQIGAFIYLSPPVEAQVELSDLLERQDQLRTAQADLVDRQNRLLLEHRQALITAAVTGQIDVTTARRFTPSESVSV